jgi:predicted nucleic acid-binding protein
VAGRKDVAVSDLTLAEAVSALARRHRESRITLEAASEVYQEMMTHLRVGVFQRFEVSSPAFREAERLMLSGLPLRTGDSLHLAIAVLSEAESIATFDRQLGAAARTVGLEVLP